MSYKLGVRHQQKRLTNKWMQTDHPYSLNTEQWAEEEVYIGTYLTDGSAEFEWTLAVTSCNGHPQLLLKETRTDNLLMLTLPTDEKMYHLVLEKRMRHSSKQHRRKTCDKDGPIEHIIRLEDSTHHTLMYSVKATLKHKYGCGPSIRDFNIAMDLDQHFLKVRFQRHS